MPDIDVNWLAWLHGNKKHAQRRRLRGWEEASVCGLILEGARLAPERLPECAACARILASGPTPAVTPDTTMRRRSVIASEAGVRVDTDTGWSGIVAIDAEGCRRYAADLLAVADEIDAHPEWVGRWAQLPDEQAPEPLGWIVLERDDGELIPISRVFANAQAAHRASTETRGYRWKPAIAVLYPATTQEAPTEGPSAAVDGRTGSGAVVGTGEAAEAISAGEGDDRGVA